jgi:diguanylate cyclase (GGDEF)-like protein/PAS domain S-box-containing protein
MAQEEMAGSEGAYRLIFDANPQPMWVFDLETLRFLAVNDAALRRYGWSRAEFLSMTLEDIRPPEEVPALRRALAETPTGPYRGIWRHRTKDGFDLDVEVTSEDLTFAARPARLVVAVDVTEARRNEAQFRFLAEHVEDAIFRFRFSPTLGFEYVSQACTRLTGYSPEEYYADPKLAVNTLHPDDVPVALALMDTAELPTEPVVLRVRRKDGALVWVEQRVTPINDPDGTRTGVIGVAHDVTDRVLLEAQLRMLATEDTLTGLRNRRGFLLLAVQLLALTQRTGTGATLLYFDVNGLKEINDTYGHAAGDAALMTVADLLRETFRDSDVVGRVGGDEFCVLAAEGSGGNDEALGRFERVLQRHNAETDRPYPLSVTLGTAEADVSGPVSIEDLMAAADAAMYQRKARNDRSQPRATPVASSPEPSGGPSTGHLRVLLADDLAEMRLMLRLTLERDERIRVVGEASDGAEALRLAEELHPDVVVLDLRMPNAHGAQVLPGIRPHAREIIVFTVVAPGAETAHAMSLGADVCINKPDFRSVARTISSLASESQ